MATIASLNVNLGMSTAKFSAGAKDVKKELGGLATASQFGNIASGIGASVAIVGQLTDKIIGTYSAFAGMVRGVVETVDKADELAQSLGTDVEQLSRLQFATEQTGGSAEALATSLAKMNRNLGEAAKGGSAAKAFTSIGLSIEDLLAMDPTRRFERIAEGLRKIDNDALRAAAAQDIFGKSAQGIFNTINAGGNTLQDLQAQSDLIGATITQLDAAKIGQIDNEIKKLEGSLSGAARALTAELAPAIVDNLNIATASIVEAKKLIDSLASTSLKDMALNTLDTVTQPFGVTLADAVGSTAAVAENISKTAENMKTIRTNAEASAGAFDGLGNDLLEKLTAQRDGFGLSAREREIQESGATGLELERLTEVAQELDAMEQMRARGLELERAATALLEDSLTPLEQHKKKLEELNAIRELGLVTDSEHAKLMAKMESDFVASQKVSESVKPDPLKEAAQDRLRDMSPMQRLNDELGEITKEFLAGFLTEEQMNLADLMARREFEQAQQQDEPAAGDQRPAALERGTAAAFSASFGPVAKPIDKVAKLTEQILEVQRRIEGALTGSTDSLGA